MVAIGNEPDSPGVEGLNDGGACGATEAVDVKPAVSGAKWWSMVRVVIEGRRRAMAGKHQFELSKRNARRGGNVHRNLVAARNAAPLPD